MFIAASIAGLWVTHQLVPLAVLKSANDVGGNFLQTFGGMYGVIVAFALFVVWQQHNDTQVALEHEAVCLSELFRVLRFFPSWPGRDAARATLREYVLAVPRNNATTTHHGQRSDERAMLSSVITEFFAWNKPNEAEQRLWGLAIDIVHETNEAREHRLTTAGLRMGLGMRGFVVLGGFFTVMTMWLLQMDSFLMQCMLTSLLTWVVVAAASIVFDLDDPFSGDFNVNWHRFTELASRMSDNL